MMLALVPLLTSLGAWSVLLLAGLVFAETGLLVGFFLPGDSLLFAAGLLAAAGAIQVPVLVLAVVAWVAASLGDQVGYWMGGRIGSAWENRARPRPAAIVRHLAAARVFFDRHGHLAIVLARFTPLVRTFTPFVAGAAGMPHRRFTAYNIGGGLAWVATMMTAGWFLGGVPIIASHVDLAVVGLVALSLVPTAIAWRRRRAAAGSEATQTAIRLAERPAPIA